jgi:hypothetical protein
LESLACNVIGVGVFCGTLSDALSAVGNGFGPVHICAAVACSVLPFRVVLA